MTAPGALMDAARTLMQLPRLAWSEDPVYGLTLTAEGTDDQVRADVWAWAQAFGVKPTVVEPEPMHRGWQTMMPGWIAVELPVFGFEVTVAGRLSGKRGGR